MAACPTCGADAGAANYCSNCGNLLGMTPAPASEPRTDSVPWPGQAPGPAYHPGAPSPAPGAPTEGVAIAALLLNILIWPGLGSLLAGEKVGWAQGFLMLFGIPLALVLIGIPMIVGAWIWGIVTGVHLLQRAGEAKQAAYRPPSA